MRHQQLDFSAGFEVTLGNGAAQAAVMTIAPGESEGGPENRHRGSDQWLFVVSGDGEATVGGKTIELRKGSLLLIERGETHEIRNTGARPLATVNFYIPPAYDESGEPLPSGRS